MEKTRIELFKYPNLDYSTSTKIVRIGSLLFFLYGGTMLTLNIMGGEFGFTLDTINPILYILLSFSYLFQDMQAKRNQKSSYMEFSDAKIQYQLGPKTPTTRIKIKDIENIEVELLSVTVTHKKGKESTITLNDMSYSTIQELKAKFFELKSSLDTPEEEEELETAS